jgi:hypothetical protein
VVTTELGERLSAQATVECWRRFRLADLSPQLAAARGQATVLLRPAPGSGGFMVTAEVVRQDGGEPPILRAAGVDIPRDGRAGPADRIVLP